jgi:hypothetical protein
MHHSLTLLVLVAVPSLVGPTATERKQAAVAWSRAHGPLAEPRRGGPDGGSDCFTARAPAPAKCEKTIELCLVEQYGGFPGDTSASSLELSLGAHAPSLPLRMRDLALADERECEPPPSFPNSPPPTRAQAQAAKRALDACVKAEQTRLDRLATDYRCTLLAINPCRFEAYVSCQGRAAGKAVRGTFWFSFSPDAGDTGAWEQGAPLVDPASE